MSARRVAVVGGGLAGITAALECERGGAQVTLLESRGRLGGAAFSFTRRGLCVDNGQHVFLRCCTAYRELLEALGAEQMVALQPRLKIPVFSPDGRRATLSRSNLPAPLHLIGSLARYRLLPPRDRATVAWAMAALARIDPEDREADERSFGEWLSEHRQSSEALAAVWELIARPTLNLVPSDASLAQAAHVFQVGLLQETASADIGYARVPLSQIHDLAARRALAAAGVDVRLRSGASSVVPSAGGFRIEISGVPTVEADVVIVAVPPDRAGRLLPPGSGIEGAKLPRLGRSPIVNLHVVYGRQVLDVPFAAGVRSPVQWIFDRTASSGLPAGQYLVVSLSAADEELPMSVEELRARYVPALDGLLGGAGEPEDFFVTREHAATFRAGPGSRALRPGALTAIPGLVVAGSWTDTGWPATMEGAVRSGRAAAGVALESRLSAPRTATAGANGNGAIAPAGAGVPTGGSR
jgi:squalene-associated FAD-dependent desaturase